MRLGLILLSKLIHLFPVNYDCLHGKYSCEPGQQHSLLPNPDMMLYLPTGWNTRIFSPAVSYRDATTHTKETICGREALQK